MQIIHEAELILQAAGFRTGRSLESDEQIIFEDDTLIGFVAVFLSPSALIDGWREAQDYFLRRNALPLRRDPIKAWNVYAVLLCEPEASIDERSQLAAFEEELSGTRKIARAGVASRSALARSLAPLLPLAPISAFDTEDPDVMLAGRLNDDEQQFLRWAQTNEPEARVAEWLFGGADQ